MTSTCVALVGSALAALAVDDVAAVGAGVAAEGSELRVVGVGSFACAGAEANEADDDDVVVLGDKAAEVLPETGVVTVGAVVVVAVGSRVKAHAPTPTKTNTNANATTKVDALLGARTAVVASTSRLRASLTVSDDATSRVEPPIPIGSVSRDGCVATGAAAAARAGGGACGSPW